MSDGQDERLVSLVHDLRTPLTIVQGFADLLSRRGATLTEEQREE
jgi:K+-sensing histidine kinase KdpD